MEIYDWAERKPKVLINDKFLTLSHKLCVFKWPTVKRQKERKLAEHINKTPEKSSVFMHFLYFWRRVRQGVISFF